MAVTITVIKVTIVIISGFGDCESSSSRNTNGRGKSEILFKYSWIPKSSSRQLIGVPFYMEIDSNYFIYVHKYNNIYFIGNCTITSGEKDLYLINSSTLNCTKWSSTRCIYWYNSGILIICWKCIKFYL